MSQIKRLLENCKEGYNYIIYHPDKTSVIIQIYIINPFSLALFQFIEFILTIFRKLVFLFKKE